MATYKSEKVGLQASAEKVYNRLSNLEGLGDILKRVPEEQVPSDQRALLEQVRVTPDTISFPAGPAGEITLRVAELVEPTLIRLVGEGSPVPLSMEMQITPIDASLCEAMVVIDIQIPAMLKPMINGPMQKMADQFAQMLRQLPLNN